MGSVALVVGNFNVLHSGHIRLLKFAATVADQLAVGVLSDRLAGKAVETPQDQRLEAVSEINSVDSCFLVDKPIKEIIREHQPDFLVKGKEFEGKRNPEKSVLKSYGGQLIFSSGEPVSANSSKLKQIEKTKNILLHRAKGLINRHNISTKRLRQYLEQFPNKKICILGDLIVDEYVDCSPHGMSREEPTLVVIPQETKRFLGGAGIVAAHAAKLGAQVKFLSVTGNDEARDFAANELENSGVDYKFLVEPGRPTTVKQRFRSQGKSLLKVSTLSQQAISKKAQASIVQEFQKFAHDCDLLVFSDFNYGFLPQALINKISRIASLHNVMIAADSQSSSQAGDISRFKGAKLITPTEHEARIALKNYDDGLVVLADKLIAKNGAQNILLKLGADGLIAQHTSSTKESPHTDQFPALNVNPLDVSGAGDSLLIIASMALAAGATIWEAGLLGSISASIQVSRLGNEPIASTDILEVLK